MNPMVSVVLPVYNSERYIKKTIESILNQTYENFELLIIDDCPTDDTMLEVASIHDDRICVIHNETNRGIAFSRNRGIACGKGRYIMLMDHDDLSTKTRLEKQVSFLEKNPDIDVVGGRIRMIDEEDNFISDIWSVNQSPQVLKALLLMINPYSNSEVTFRREFVIKHDIKYDDHMLGLEDFKFWIQCSKVGRLSNIDDLVLYRRIMKSSETGRVIEMKLKERLKLYSELQEFSLKLSGIYLSNSELEVLHKVVSDGRGMCESGDELKKFYNCMSEIIRQAYDQHADFMEGLFEAARSLLLSKSASIGDEWFWR